MGHLQKQNPVLSASPLTPPALGLLPITLVEPQPWHRGRQRLHVKQGIANDEEGNLHWGQRISVGISGSPLLLADIRRVRVGFLTFPHFLPPGLGFK